MENIIVAFYCIIDDLLETIGHREYSRRIMADEEVITTALVAARFFGGNPLQASRYLKETSWIRLLANMELAIPFKRPDI
jgi:hypothetical protein